MQGFEVTQHHHLPPNFHSHGQAHTGFIRYLTRRPMHCKTISVLVLRWMVFAMCLFDILAVCSLLRVRLCRVCVPPIFMTMTFSLGLFFQCQRTFLLMCRIQRTPFLSTTQRAAPTSCTDHPPISALSNKALPHTHESVQLWICFFDQDRIVSPYTMAPAVVDMRFRTHPAQTHSVKTCEADGSRWDSYTLTRGAPSIELSESLHFTLR